MSVTVTELKAEDQTPAPAERKPWHAPTLAQVDLQLTANSSGSFNDGEVESVG